MASNPYTSPEGFHRHCCRECGYVWEHRTLALPPAGSHDCPRCTTPNYFQYEGPAAPGDFDESEIRQGGAFYA